MAEPLEIRVDERYGSVSALLEQPPGAHCLLAMAHGAGADMHHRFMEAASVALAERGVATLRYQFPYTEAGGRRPSPRRALLATVSAAVRAARERAAGAPILAGGKSMGGRMTSLCAAAGDLVPEVRGLVFFGFPMHAAGKPPSRERAEHLFELDVPKLFLQGTRDKLAPRDEIESLCGDLGASTRLHLVDGGDHGFQVLKRSGRSEGEVLAELAEAVADFARECAG